MKIACKFIMSCFLLLCTVFAAPTFVKAYNYKYIWSSLYFTSDDKIIFHFMGAHYAYYDEVDRYLIPFVILYDGKIIYRGVAEAPRKMTTKNSLEELCEGNHINMNMKGAEKAKELCEKSKSMKEYEVDEIVETQLYPTFLVSEALMAQDKYFNFKITIGSEYGDSYAGHQENLLEVDLTPGAENVPEWVYKVFGTFGSGLG